MVGDDRLSGVDIEDGEVEWHRDDRNEVAVSRDRL
jgi:hypothetical protein